MTGLSRRHQTPPAIIVRRHHASESVVNTPSHPWLAPVIAAVVVAAGAVALWLWKPVRPAGTEPTGRPPAAPADDLQWEEARAKKLFLFHHDPAHGDDKIDEMLERARFLVAESGRKLEVEAAREGSEVILS